MQSSSSLLLSALLTSCSLASVLRPSLPSDFCSHPAPSLHTSRWHQQLASGLFLPYPDPTNLHLANLRSTLAELGFIINLKKNHFARDELSRSWSSRDRAFSTVSYSVLVPEGSLAPASSWAGRVLAAYDIFQRLGLVVEVVRADIARHRDSSARTEHLWQLVERGVGRVLEHLYTELVVLEVEVPAALAREVIPQALRCVRDSIGRDVRDFLVLRHVLQVVGVFGQQLETP